MPKKSAYNRMRRRMRRRLRRGRRKVNPAYNMGPLSVKLKTKFLYSDRFQLNPGIGGIAGNYVFSCNGIYDPNVTGIGHQPRGFDELMELYDHYVVIGFKAEIWMANTDVANAQNICAYIKDDATPLPTVDDIIENRYIKWQVLAPEGSGRNTGKMTIQVNPTKFLGRSKPLSDPQLKGSTVANPAEQCNLIISAFPFTTTDTGPIECHVRLSYTTILIEPKQPGSS